MAIGLLVLSIVTLSRTLDSLAWTDVRTALAAIPTWHVLVCLLFTGCSYLALTGYDLLGLRYLGKELPYSRVALGSFLSYAFANNLGFALLTGGTARYRIYASAGLRASDIALLTLICGLTFALSGTLVAALCLILEPSALGLLIGISSWLTLLLGMILLGLLAAYVVWVGGSPKSLRWGLRSLPLPGAGSTLSQFGVGLADLGTAAAALYMLLPDSANIGFLPFVGVFAIAMTLGLASHVPGGIGVFETVILLAMPSTPASALFASLLVFRCIYYLVPLLIALGLFAWSEAARLPGYQRFLGWLEVLSGQAIGTARQVVEIAAQQAWMLAGIVWRRISAPTSRA
ncbi:MAG: lysylphosphatidylglycerol synthase domain-containing protein [Hyphomicrobiaceae bacterium]